MVDTEQAEIVADEVEHRLDRSRRGTAAAIRLRARRRIGRHIRPRAGPDGHQIFAGYKPSGISPILPERLAVPEVHRAGERIDLRAGVVDIIFLGDAKPGRFEQPGEAVADHGAAAMAHVHRPGRVGRHIFDIDPLVAADRRQAIVVALAQDRPEFVAPGIGGQPEIDESRPGDLDRGHRRERFQLGLDRFGERARVGSGGLGKHHRGVGREVAVRRIARRLDRHAAAIQAVGQRAVGNELIEHSVEERGILGVKAQTGVHRRLGKRAPLAQAQPRVTLAGTSLTAVRLLRGCRASISLRAWFGDFFSEQLEWPVTRPRSSITWFIVGFARLMRARRPRLAPWFTRRHKFGSGSG